MDITNKINNKRENLRKVEAQIQELQSKLRLKKGEIRKLEVLEKALQAKEASSHEASEIARELSSLAGVDLEVSTESLIVLSPYGDNTIKLNKKKDKILIFNNKYLEERVAEMCELAAHAIPLCILQINGEAYLGFSERDRFYLEEMEMDAKLFASLTEISVIEITEEIEGRVGTTLSRFHLKTKDGLIYQDGELFSIEDWI